LETGGAQAVAVSGHSVLVDAIRLRYGVTPTIFDLP
jgi:hypothetical protein